MRASLFISMIVKLTRISDKQIMSINFSMKLFEKKSKNNLKKSDKTLP